VVDPVAAAIAAEYFQTIANHLARALAADCVLLGEFAGGRMERVRTLGACLDGRPFRFDYDLAESASRTLFAGETCQCHAAAGELFPADQLISAVGAQAMAGVPLLDRRNEAAGLLLALYRRPVASLGPVLRMLHVVSLRAAARLHRKRAADRVRESRQRYRAFIAASTDAMWRIEFEQPIDTTLDADDQLNRMYRYGYLAECNDAMAAMLGREKARQAIGCSLEEVAPRSDPGNYEATMIAIRNRYASTTVEIARLDPQGHRRRLLCSRWGVVEHGKLERFWGTARDVTDQRESQQALQAYERRLAAVEAQLGQARELAAIGTLAGSVAHDFNDLLTVILGYAHLLQDGRRLDPAAGAALEEIRSAAGRGVELTHRLLVFGCRRLLPVEVLGLHSPAADGAE